MLYLNVAVGDGLSIDGGRIVLHFERKSGQVIRVGVDAPREVTVTPIPKTKEADPEPRKAPGLSLSQMTGRKSGRSMTKQHAQEGGQ